MDETFNSPPSSPLSVLDSIPSSPLSMRSRSPTPPFDYPSPDSSNSRASSKDRAMRLGLEPPAKRHKITSASGRTTDYLDLNSADEDPKSDDGLNLQRLLHSLRRKKKIVVIAGAGISVSAGSKYTTTSRPQIELYKFRSSACSGTFYDPEVFRSKEIQPLTSFSSPGLQIEYRALQNLTSTTQPEIIWKRSLRRVSV